MSFLTLRLLGSWHSEVGGAVVTQFRSRKVRALLAYLSVESDHAHERASLAGLLWPDLPDEKAFNNLSQTLVGIRQAVQDYSAQPPFLLTDRRFVGWNTASDYFLDVTEFRRIVRRGPLAGMRTAELEAAAELYRGELLSGFAVDGSPAFEEWLLFRREELQQQALELLAALTDQTLRSRSYGAAQHHARRQLEIDPWREPAHRQLMLALVAAGNRTAALQQYEQCERILRQELGVPPQRATIDLYEQIRSGAFDPGIASPDVLPLPPSPPPAIRSAPTASLPLQLTPIMGRDTQVADLVDRLLDPTCRLITVVGAGGVGKTRLAVAVAEALRGRYNARFEHGIWFVPLGSVLSHLAGVGPPTVADEAVSFVAMSVASTIGFVPAGEDNIAVQLVEYLRHRRLLLILDSFEYWLAARPWLVDLLGQAPNIQLLVTSQSRLLLQGESLLQVEGLPLPPAPDVEDVADYASVNLFCARARSHIPNLAPTPADLAEIARICRLVEGLPLGIELAASWLEHYSYAEIADGIQERLEFLESTESSLPARQHSLLAALDYSWRLLSPEEQYMFAYLAVFRRSFSREAALHVSGCAITTLIGLVNKSVLERVASGRYRMHELLRSFASGKLAQMDPAVQEAVHERYSTYFLQSSGRTPALLLDRSVQDALTRLAFDIADIRTAIFWAIHARRPDLIAANLTGLCMLYRLQSFHDEAAATLDQLIDLVQKALAERPEDAALSGLLGNLYAERAHALILIGATKAAAKVARQAVEQGSRASDRKSEAAGYLYEGLAEHYLLNTAKAQSQLQKGLELVQGLSQEGSAADLEIQLLKARGLYYLAVVCLFGGEEDRARRYQEEAISLYRSVDYWWGEAKATYFFGDGYAATGNYWRAQRYYADALALFNRQQNAAGQCHMHRELCRMYTWMGDYAAARQHGIQALHLSRDLGSRRARAFALSALGWCEHLAGDDGGGLAHVEEAVTVAEAIGNYALLAHCLENQGGVLVGLGRLVEAKRVHKRSLQIRLKEGLLHSAMQSLAALADLTLSSGSLGEAQVHVDEILQIRKTVPLDRTESPLFIHLTCYRVLAQAGDERAEPMLAETHALLEQQAALIESPALRRSFLEGVAVNRAIRSAWGEWHSADASSILGERHEH